MINVATDSRRVTLVCNASGSQPNWNTSHHALSRVISVRSLPVLRDAIALAIESSVDLERVIIDRSATGEEFLSLLTSLPAVFNGDVLRISQDGSAFLSAAGRGDGRMLYALSAADVGFYFLTHGLLRTAARKLHAPAEATPLMQHIAAA